VAENYYISNKIEQLIDKFCENITQRPDIFKPEIIVTQTHGMEQWISAEVAGKLGIFTNYKFLKPENLITELYALAELHPSYQYSTQRMQWEIYSILTTEAFITKFPQIAAYYQNDLTKQSQLALKIADLFDQYMVYRPDYIELWNSNSHPQLEKGNSIVDFMTHEAWQSWIWMQLKERFKSTPVDQVELKKLLLQKFNDTQFVEKIKNSFERISMVALSILTPFHKEILDRLAQFISLNYYLINPSPETDWHVADSLETKGNDILTSCKPAGQHIFSMLLNNSNTTIHRLIEETTTTKTLLEVIQYDIYHNNHKGIRKVNLHPNDRSLQIASSYTPVREVEALYNYLLKSFQDNPTLNLRDVVVQLAEPEKYAPFIDAVFKNGPVNLPYCIADKLLAEGDTLLNGLEKFFALPQNQFSADTVMQLLESKYIRNKFGIENLDTLKTLVKQANIRYGEKGRKEDDTYLMSWNHGLTKLMMSYAIKGNVEFAMEDETFYLPDNIEGAAAYDLFRLKSFIDEVFRLHSLLNSPRTLIQWKEFLLKDVIESLFELDDTCTEEYEQILNKLQTIDDIKNDFIELLPFSVFQKTILFEISHETKKSSYISGVITFSPILPVRSIPYKIIAMLGMNSDVFPRKQNPLGFDLINFDVRSGDRNVRNNDKYLFLESVLAARSQLYLSYMGPSVHDNTNLPPSLLIDELMDYLKLGISDELLEKQIVFNHPLHGFSKKYYDKNSKFHTYFGRSLSNENLVVETKFKPENDFNLITLKNLFDFLKNPFKWYYNKTLNIYYNDLDDSLPETEPFELDTLQEWQLKQDLISLDDSALSTYIEGGKSCSKLPLGNMAQIEIETQLRQIQEVKTAYQELIAGKKQDTFSDELDFNGKILRGQITQLFDNCQVVYNASKESRQSKYLIEMWLNHLFLIAANKAIETHYISGGLSFKLPTTLIDSAGAKHILKQLIAYFELGHKEIIPFTPNAGENLIRGMYKNPDKQEDLIVSALDSIKQEGSPGYNKPYFDAYIAKEMELGYFNDFNNLNTDAFCQLSELLFKPLFQAQILK